MAFWDVVRRWFADKNDQQDSDPGGGVALIDPPRQHEFHADRRSASRELGIEGAIDRNEDDGEIGEGWWVPNSERMPPPGTPTRPATVDSDLHNYLLGVLKDPNLELPRLPQVASQALSMLSGASCDFRRLSELIGRDPALTADVLRLANSVAYRGIKEIAQLEQAFVRMGVRGVRSLLLTTSVKGLAIRTGGEKSLAQEVWQRSVASGVILATLADRFDLPEDDAFLVGLLHDIGDLVLLRIIYDQQKAGGRKIPRSVFFSLSTQWHQHLGLRFADAWNLPDPLPQLIGQHHGAPGSNEPERTYRLLIGVSDVACSMMQYAPYVAHDFFKLPCVTELNLHNNAETRQVLGSLPGKIDDRLAVF